MQNENIPVSANAVTLARKSWVAYVGVILLGVIATLLAAMFGVTFHSNHLLIGLVYAVVMAYVIYRVCYIKSHHLYFDDTSVWFFSGIFPWNRGVYGVKWRDISEAVYYTKFWSWALNSYEIRVGHRFTNESELRISNMKAGNNAVAMINAKLADLTRAGKLN